MDQQQPSVDTLNSLLRGELAATETYQQALDKVGNEPGSAELRSIHADHRETANEIRKLVHQAGGKPDQDSGTWGTFAKAVQGTAKIFGETAALKALKQGEEQGISSYESALKDTKIPADGQALLRGSLNRCRSHVQTLDRLMESPQRA